MHCKKPSPRHATFTIPLFAAAALLVAASAAEGQVADSVFARLSAVGLAQADVNMNAIAFRANALQTVGNQQFVTYYDDDRTVVVARRLLGADNWETFDTGFVDVYSGGNDDHNVISFGVDGAGVMHMSWGMHNNPLLYARSTGPVTGEVSIEFEAPSGMTGVNENRVTYPQFYNASDGDLLFFYRNGASGNGDTQINRYDRSADTWQSVQKPLFDGEIAGDGIPSLNAYPQTWGLDSQGNIHLTWTSRFQGDSPAGESGYQTNHNFFYAVSPDEGVTWNRSNGTEYTPVPGSTAPISESNAEVVIEIPEGSSLINQASMTIDNSDRPVLASWWAPGAPSGDHTRQYMLGWFDGVDWRTSQITERPSESKKNEAFVRDLGRPIVVVDDDDRTIVAMRYKEAGNVITIAHSTDRQNWEFLDLTTEDLGVFEPTYDQTLWERENKLHILYQPVQTGPTATTLSVLEWDAASYFDAISSPLALVVDRYSGEASLVNTGSQAVEIDGYTVSSVVGSIAPPGWKSLEEVGEAGWEEANRTVERISELNPNGSLQVAAGSSVGLGVIFSPEQTAFGSDATADLGFRFTSPDGATRNGDVSYVGESSNNLIIEVDQDTGRVQLVNGSKHPVSIDAYTISSRAESLVPSDGGWTSLAATAALGGVWDEANADSGRLSELAPSGASELSPGDSVTLGLAFSAGDEADLVFEFLKAGESLPSRGVVRYHQLGIPGDFNGDSEVNAADYTVWRDALGTGEILANDLTPGSVTQEDYDVWRSFFGYTYPAEALGSTAVPSPPTTALILSCTFAFGRRRRYDGEHA